MLMWSGCCLLPAASSLYSLYSSYSLCKVCLLARESAYAPDPPQILSLYCIVQVHMTEQHSVQLSTVVQMRAPVKPSLVCILPTYCTLTANSTATAYRPGRPPCAIAAFCSWNLSPRRCEPFMCLSTHRITQPSSREVSDLLSKPLTQESKHCWTRLEYICNRYLPSHSRQLRRIQTRRSGHVRTFMNSFICFFSMRFWSSRCSFCVSLHAVSVQ